ncbi:MAG TPA: hypothetical protein DCY13_13875, partial [Verrucomicrobiales bacterium]|nr:hypothetical protein [Verrucomicrobiales bacterium]
MNLDPIQTSAEELQRRRDAVHRALTRANTAGFAIVLGVVALALVAISLGRRAAQERARAEERLFEASLAQVQALRLAGRPGNRGASLDALRTAAGIRQNPELLEQAAAVLATVDFSPLPERHPLPEDTVHVAVDRDLTAVAAADAKGALHVSRLDASAPPVFLRTDAMSVNHLALTTGGRFVAGIFDDRLQVWDPAAGKVLLERPAQLNGLLNRPLLDETEGVESILCLDDSRTLSLRRLPDGQQLAVLQAERPWSPVAWHPRSGLVAIQAANRELELWNVKTQSRLWRLPPLPQMVSSASWSADARWLALGLGYYHLRVVDTATLQMTGWQGHTREEVRAILRPQGDLLASHSADGVMRIWDALAGTLQLSSGGAQPLGFDADGVRLAVWSGVEGVRLWQTTASPVHRVLKVPPGYPAWCGDEVAFSPDGSRLVTTGPAGLWTWETGDRAPVFTRAAEGGCWGLRFLDNKTLVGLGDGRLLQWRWQESGLTLMTNLAGMDRGGLAFDDLHDGRAVAYRNGGGTIIDLAGRLPDLPLEGHDGLAGFRFSPDGRWVACGTRSHDSGRWMEAFVWSAKTGERVAAFSAERSTVLFSPDSRWLVLGTPAEYFLVEPGTWAVRHGIRRTSSGGGAMAAFAPDGQLLAVQRDHGTVALVSPESGTELLRLTAPSAAALRRMTFSPDGEWLAAGSEAHVHLWHLGALQREFTGLGLGPFIAGAPPSPTAATAPPSFVAGSIPWISGILVTMAVAIGLAIWLRQYQRQMLARHLEVEELTARRGELLQRAQTELAHSQKMRALGTLAAGIAHDFNNLLSVIRLSNCLTARAAGDHPEVRENTAEIEEAVEQGRKVVRSMLGYSSASTETTEPFQVAELLDSLVRLLGRQFLGGIEVGLHLPPDLPPVRAPRGPLDQILLNLIVNASEAMDGRGRLDLSAELATGPQPDCVLSPKPAPAYLRLVVADSGPGIAPDQLPRIFEPFYTTKNAGAKRGTGLGLSQVHELARAAG